jgi:hypothetical protein
MTATMNSHAHARIKRLLISPMLLAWLGCSDVTASVAPADTPVAAAVALVTTPVSAAEIEDALDRVLPAMSDGAGSKGLATAFSALLDALSHGGSGAAMAVESAERALDGFARAVGEGTGDDVHIDVIALALASVRGRVEGK